MQQVKKQKTKITKEFVIEYIIDPIILFGSNPSTYYFLRKSNCF